MDRTKDLRGSRSLLFISFQKGHTSDIRPATLSSWLKQTILLCYKQADQQALDLVQVKAHDIRAFTASKAFLRWGIGGPNHASLSLEISQHIYSFYLKDLTWSHNDNIMYLGPVVVAHQVQDPSPQIICPHNTYTCPLQPCRHLTLKLLIQGHPRSAKVPHIADFKSAYISLIIGPTGLQCETNQTGNHDLLQGLTRIAQLKSAYNSLIIDPRCLGW